MGKLITISDLHFWGPEDALYRAFLKFLDERIENGDRLVLVGDVFDLFVGGKKVFVERYFELIARLRDFRNRGVEVFYIEGNHDFHLEDVFDDCPHVHLYADHLNMTWGNRSILFSHGDRVNPKDYGYHAFRFLTHNIVTQCLIAALPGELIDKVGCTMSRASRDRHYEATEEIVQLFRNYACDQISSGHDLVVMGHIHHFEDMRFRIDSRECQYVNAGYPRKHRRYFEMAEGDMFFTSKSWDSLIVPLRPIAQQEGE